LQLQCVLQKIKIVHIVQMLLLLLLLRLTTMKLLLQTCISVAAAVPVVAGVDAHFVLSCIAFWAHKPAVWQHTACNSSLLLQGFVKYTKVGVYRMQQVWEQAAAQREIMAAFLSDSRIKYELGSSKLALSSRDVDIVVKKAIKALVHSLQVRTPAPHVHHSSLLNMSETVGLTHFKLAQQWVLNSGWADNNGYTAVG